MLRQTDAEINKKVARETDPCEAFARQFSVAAEAARLGYLEQGRLKFAYERGSKLVSKARTLSNKPSMCAFVCVCG